MRNAIANCIIEVAKKDSNVFLISGDAGLGVWDTFKEEYKEQYINPGINEALCVSMAAGLALCGRKVVYYNIAPFVMMRPYEQVRNDICYQELPVILVGTGSGFTYMPSGMTHYALEDIGLALSLPNLNIFSPCDPLEAKACFQYAYHSKKPSYIRIPKAGEPNLHKREIEDVAQLQFLLKNKSEILLLSHSSIVQEVLKAGEILGCDVASKPFINSMDFNLESYKIIFVIEEHFSYGGLGTFLRSHTNANIEILGVPNKYVHLIGNCDYGRTFFGIDCKGIVESVQKRMEL
ncbi:transketolase family protein [Helicobacter canadensis]|uniref:Transketolase, C-terminal subunit n=1 Tax=Helicobacter canadensis MIT 98-5491 TaxID=537970 RepID=C5ZZ92_9HELI|nr:transketolase [Helicobacter canadensis]EES89350.1 transketolase, C-terminal subunit [Helicobacter canadensis MIT 98-5491]EFR48137.1 Transketolase, pyridine binding domain protein [Helicobacter canadensis MIT 98-5491]STO99385.1 transketolase C-terminal subunit [Helicobacter canadensis]